MGILEGLQGSEEEDAKLLKGKLIPLPTSPPCSRGLLLSAGCIKSYKAALIL